MGEIVVELIGIDPDGGAEVTGQEYALVRGSESVKVLRQTHRIYGVVESGAEGRAQTLRLSLEELGVGLAHDFLELKTAPTGDAGRVVSKDWSQGIARDLARAARGEECGSASALDPVRRDRVRVFHDLWERGYFVTFGSKFGADFLIYSDDPARTHAVALVIVKAFEAPFPRVDVVSYGRVAKMVKKQLYFASVRPRPPNEVEHRNDVVFVLLTHALLASRQEEDAEEEEEEEEE